MSPSSRIVVRQMVVLALLVAGAACSRARPVVHPAPVESARDPRGNLPPASRATPTPERRVQRELMVPVLGVEPAGVRDTYTAGRGGGRTHDAVDIVAPRGTPVVAADDGTILKLRRNDAGGITIYQLDANDRFVYYYAHLERYQRGLSEGLRVRQGDVLGFVGTTGNAPDNLPHLHFQVMQYRGGGLYWGGEPVNPTGWFTRPGKRN